MLFEEAFLQSEFGEQFTDWIQKTPAFIPSWHYYTPPNLTLSLRNVLRREYNTLLQIVVVGFLREFFGDWLTQTPAPRHPAPGHARSQPRKGTL